MTLALPTSNLFVKQSSLKMQIQAFFKKAAAPAPAKKGTSSTAKVVKPSRKSTGGWLGGQGGAVNLDKWYGEF